MDNLPILNQPRHCGGCRKCGGCNNKKQGNSIVVNQIENLLFCGTGWSGQSGCSSSDNCDDECPMGETGAVGPTGTNGIVGPTGADGAVGPTGADGVTGPTGANGVDGINGADGAPGVDGVAGPTGANGVDGASGADGAVGPPGADGVNGINGVDGAPGVDGVDGVDGAVGPPGADGVNGVDGAPGADGAIGPTGANGVDGINGVDGPTGADGAIGPTGANGETGPAGATAPTPLTDYEEITLPVTFVGPFAPQTMPVRMVRVGKFINLTFTESIDQPSIASSAITAVAGSIPARFAPSEILHGLTIVQENTVDIQGTYAIHPDGSIRVTAFISVDFINLGNTGFASFSIGYSIA